MKCPSLIVFIYFTFCFTLCFSAVSQAWSIPGNLSLSDLNNPEKIINKTEDGANYLIENTKWLGKYKETAHDAKDFMADYARKLLPNKIKGEQLFLQRNCISHKFSRRSLSQYYNSMVDHPYQCESLSNGTDMFRRIIGCETESKNFVCYGISETDPLPEPDEHGNACYEIVNNSYESPDCHCPNLLIHAGIHAVSAAIICLLFIVFCCQCRSSRRRNRKQPEDIDFDFVKHNRSNLSR